MKKYSIATRRPTWLGLVLVIIVFPHTTNAQWTASGNDVYKTNTAGNVGIGTNSPAQKLDVVGNILLEGNWYGINKASGEARAVMFNGALLSDSDYLYFGSFNNGFKFVDANNSTLLTIKENGNVGIGTTSPGEKLDVSGTFRASGQNSAPTSGAGVEASYGGGVGYIQSYDRGAGTNKPLYISGSSIQLNAGGEGNVGIGTTNPNVGKLHSVGDANHWSGYFLGNSTSGQSYGLLIDSGTNSSDNSVRVRSQAGAEYLLVRGDGNVGIATTNPLARFHVHTNADENLWVRSANGLDLTAAKDDGSNFVKLNINASPFIINAGSGGNVGIGTASPQGKLHVKTGTDRNIWLRDGGSTQKAQIISVADDNGTINTLSIDGSNLLLNSQSTGTVGIGTATPNSSYKLDVNGDVRVSGNISAKYQDVAEWVPSSEKLPAGTVVVLDSTKTNQVTSSSVSYDTRVAGVVSEQPGIALGEKSENKILVATTGRVRVRADASKNPIHIGDLLVTSDVPGMAMKSEPIMIGGRRIHAPGTLIGKALEPLEKGSGTILVLLSLQ
jgi:hypothetical protein